MTRAFSPLALALITVAAGCASAPQPPPAAPPPQVVYTYPDVPFSAPASALVFDPPVAAYLPPIDLSREPRQAMAFGGFQQSTETFSFIRTDDRQSTAYRDSYDRRTISVQVGTSSR